MRPPSGWPARENWISMYLPCPQKQTEKGESGGKKKTNGEGEISCQQSLAPRHTDVHFPALTKRLELLLRTVLALPKASSRGLDSRITFLTRCHSHTRTHNKIRTLAKQKRSKREERKDEEQEKIQRARGEKKGQPEKNQGGQTGRKGRKGLWQR